jgi:Tachylectin
MLTKINRRSFAAMAPAFAAAALLSPSNGLARQASTVRVFHSGNAMGEADGVIYAIRPNGDLHWYRYLGTGKDDRSGATGWHPNSGNRIGNGWGDLLQVIGYGNGVILAVKRNGDLHWYKYEGNGEDNVSASTGWHPNSGNPIGNGWHGLQHMFATPSDGSSAGIVYGIVPNGDLRWYSYRGNGEADRSGATGWHANSGNPIGNGWGGLRYVVGGGRFGQIFAVPASGNLQWFQYTGDGTSDVSGATGWSSNSGNPVGNGWNVASLFGGPGIGDEFGATLFAIDNNRDLRWFAYGGGGQSDVSGATGWHPNSGNFIGNGW